MKAESLTFSSCGLPSSDLRSSRSRPAQKALPEPVMTSTCALERSTSSNARRSSSTSSKLIALRLSGRLSVIVAMRSALSSSRVLNGMNGLVYAHVAGNLTRHLQKPSERFANGRLEVALRQSFQNNFGRDIADQFILSERASAKSGERGIEAPAASIVSRKDFFRGLLAAAVQMHTDLEMRKFSDDGLHHTRDFLRI